MLDAADAEKDDDVDAAMVSEVYFPLLCVVLPLWLHLCSPTALESVVPVQDTNTSRPTPFAVRQNILHCLPL